MEYLFSQSTLFEFNTLQLVMTCLVFTWSGFVRSGLGFGGAALGLPLMLFIDDQPLFWLPVIGTHLLIFTGWTLRTRLKNVDWVFLKKSSVYILPAKLIGVFGLINLPNSLLIIIIYSITLIYAFLWLLSIRIQSENGWTDKLLLVIGGYVSGTSLTGAPLIVAVFMNHIRKNQLRDTLFLLWFFLVSVKMTTFVVFSIDLHTVSALLLIPAATIGHIIGLKTHEFMLQNDALFKRILGGVLIIISSLGLINIL